MFTMKKNGIGIGKLIDIIRGSKSKPILEFSECPTYGQGKKYTIDLLKELVKVLVLNDYLKEVSLNQKFGSIIVTTEKTLNWWYLAKKHKLENEMAYIQWEEFNIPQSFEIIYNYLPKNNKNSDFAKRQTTLDTVLNDFNLDKDGNPIINDLDIDIDINVNNNLKEQKLLVQTTDVDTIKKKERVRRVVKKSTINNI
jgi:hypothetical protein